MARLEKTRFGAGEVSPNVAPLTDLAREQAAVAKLENMLVLIEGNVTRRPGTRFVTELRTESVKGKGVEFQFSESDTYSLVFNGGKIRFLQNGGVVIDGPDPYEITSLYTADDLPNLRWAQSGNLVFLTCLGQPPRLLTRNGPLDWALTLLQTEDGPVGPQNLQTGLTIQASAITGLINLTRVGAVFDDDDVGTVWRLDEPDFSLVPSWKGNETSLADGDQRRNGGRVYEAAVTGGSNGDNSGPNAPIHDDGAVSAGKGNPTWTYLHSGFGVVRITSVAAGGATAVATVLKRLPESVVSQPTYRWYPPVWGATRGFPEVVRLARDALFFARTDAWWISRPNDFFDFGLNDVGDTALAGRLLSPDGKRIAIRWALAQGVLLIGTASSEISLRGASAFAPLTADDTNPVPEDDQGSAPHIPELVTGGAIFIGKNRKRLHYAAFDPLAEKVDVQEITVASRHILGGGAHALAFQKDPNSVLFVQCTDRLAAVTFMPKEEVTGWSRHPMVNGLVEDCWNVTAPGGARDDVYFIVRRVIDGEIRRYIEVMQPFFAPRDRDNPTAEGAWFVDCGLSYSGPPVATLSGLEHLEGENVRIFINGADRPMQVVKNGKVSVSPVPGGPTMSAVVGLPIVAKVRGLPVEIPPPQSVKGAMRQGDALVEVVDSFGGTLAINDGPPEPLFETGAEDYGAPMPLYTGKCFPVAEVPSAPELVLEIVCDNALPFTLAGWTPNMTISEEAA